MAQSWSLGSIKPLLTKWQKVVPGQPANRIVTSVFRRRQHIQLIADTPVGVRQSLAPDNGDEGEYVVRYSRSASSNTFADQRCAWAQCLLSFSIVAWPSAIATEWVEDKY